jgi:2-polyprenyl-3-methyl-5-hydroxy-6-metoxy-1,4-benzoquinol methylase
VKRRVNEQAYVREQYETEDRLRARKSAYANAEGDDPREFAFEAVAEARPRRVLEVGGGEGELAERIVKELGAELVGIDQSERMVEIQRSKGIDARIGAVNELPFGEGEFDVAVAAWMLFHVPDLDRAIAELARVLKPTGRLVAATNSIEHFQDLWDLAGAKNPHLVFTFGSENGGKILDRHFKHVERRDTRGATTMDPATIRHFAASSENLAPLAAVAECGETVCVRTHSTVFVAEGPA